MERNYTKAVRAGFFDLIEKDTVEIWENLDRSVAMIKSGRWKEHYSEVVAKYRFSSRFAIMRVLFEKATGLSPSKTDEQALARGFSVAGIGNFPNITIKHAKELTDTEVALYQQLLLRRVEENNPRYTQEALRLVPGVLELPSAGAKCNLTRDELIRLGHMVDFSLEDMQFVLLRVLGDNEAGFKYSASADIIDIYGFLTRATLAQVDELKAWYDQNAAKIKKVEYADKPVQFTQDKANSIELVFSKWSPENRVAEFQNWLLKNAPYLDLKSKTARKIYVNLAMYAYVRATSKTCQLHFDTNDILTDNFYNDIENIAFGQEFHDFHAYAVQLFFKNSKPDLRKCDAVASELIYENAEYAGAFSAHETDSQLLYHVPYLEKGKITSRGILNKDSKDRIVAILMDQVSPAKSDLLYLLWFAANTHWIISSSAAEKASFLNDFLDAASCLLGEAFLPEFYPCGILEETMLLSIVLGNEEKSPAMIYESICSTFTEKGKKKKQTGDTMKTSAKKKEIALYFYDLLADPRKKEGYVVSKETCKKRCAEHFGIGKSSVEIYCDQFVAQYYYDHLGKNLSEEVCKLVEKYCDKDTAERYKEHIGELLSEKICKKVCADLFNKTIKSVNTCCKKYPKGLA